MKKIVIVGGGVSGLSAGIYARLAGFDATIL
jgi:thioredoxin reductase